jgi:hypothetical protein
MRIGAFQPTTYRPPGGSVQPFSQELTETFFRAIAAQSTSAVIGPGFLSLELRTTKPGKAQFVWHFNDDVDPETAQASVQIMLDMVARPLLQGARWTPQWAPREASSGRP